VLSFPVAYPKNPRTVLWGLADALRPGARLRRWPSGTPTGRGWLADAKTVDAIAKRLDQVDELAKRVSPRVLEGVPDVDGGA